MTKFKVFLIAFCAMFAAVCIASAAEAKVTITVENNTNDTLYLAFRWSGSDSSNDRRDAWYNVPAGITRTITFNIEYTLTAESFGYFAHTRSREGGKYFGGKESDGMGVFIHLNGPFAGRPDDPMPGGEKVWFKPLKLQEVKTSKGLNGVGHIVLNP
jgi:opacity protein-like surface antigen